MSYSPGILCTNAIMIHIAANATRCTPPTCMHPVALSNTDLVHAAQGGDIHGLTAHHTSGADAGGILTWPAAGWERDAHMSKPSLLRPSAHHIQAALCPRCCLSILLLQPLLLASRNMACTLLLRPHVPLTKCMQHACMAHYARKRSKIARGAHLLMMASTSTWMGFWSVSRLMISNACLTMRTCEHFTTETHSSSA